MRLFRVGVKYMLYLVALLIVSFSIGVFIYYILTGKINICKDLVVYAAIMVLPIYLIGFPLLFFLSFGDEYRKYFTFIPVTIIGLEIMILLIYIIIKINMHTYLFLNKSGNEDKRMLNIDYSIRLLRYLIFAEIFYFIPILAASVLSIYFGLLSIGTIITSIVMIVTFAFLLTIPYAVLSFISLIVATILWLFVIVTSINGVIRFSYASNTTKKKIVKYVIFMFLPILNIVCMFRIYSLAKKGVGIEQQQQSYT